MRNFAGIAIAVVTALFVLVTQTFYIVRQTQQALVFQFGQVVGVINPTGKNEPGLQVKIPFVQNTVIYDKRLIQLDFEPTEIVASDQERLRMDAIARYHIVDPLLFYQSVRTIDTAESRLNGFVSSAMRRVLGRVTSTDIISGQRAELMRQIGIEANLNAKPLGIAITDVRILRADLPEANRDRVFQRMAAERAQRATELRAQGEQRATEIVAEAERVATVTRAEAQEQAERIRGEGEARRAELFSQAFGRDPQFASFYRSMQAYEKSLRGDNTTMVIAPDGEFFKQMGER
jgi:membrane protease subunit HflC